MKHSILNHFLNNPQQTLKDIGFAKVQLAETGASATCYLPCGTTPYSVDLTTGQWHRFDGTYGGDLFYLYAFVNELAKDTPKGLLVTQMALELGIEARPYE